jgi:putative Holliday junction resolvase
VLQRTSDDNDCRVIADIATAEHIKTIVLGYPLSMDGSVGSAAAVAESFAKKLKEHGVRVKLWDERLTTAEAERSLKHTGMKGRARRAVVDKVAASVILQSYLDAQHAKKR